MGKFMSSDGEEPISKGMISSMDIDSENANCFLVIAILTALLCIGGYVGYMSANNPEAALAASVAFGLAAVCFSLLYIGLQMRYLASIKV
ncbi:MAG: hypothetical protein ACFFAZ_03970 [Promethearchaeota archaeon]